MKLLLELQQKVERRTRIKPLERPKLILDGIFPEKSFAPRTENLNPLKSLFPNAVKALLVFLNLLFFFLIMEPVFSGIYVKSAGVHGFPYSLPEQNSVDSLINESMIREEVSEKKTAPARSGTISRITFTPHTYKKGETIAALAQKFKLNMDTIISYNDIKNVKALQPGAVLLLPNTDGIKHVVARGDTLSSIASRYKIALNDLLDFNNISSAVIQPRDALFIPGARMRKNELNKALGTLFLFPTTGMISSPFGYRIHPIWGTRHFHNGIDITNWPGTVVKAAMDGRVIQTGYNNIYGNYIIIGHDDGYQTMYGHLSEILVAKGKNVNQAQKIGKMGNTGLSTGPHLHFSIFHTGEPINPMKVLDH